MKERTLKTKLLTVLLTLCLAPSCRLRRLRILDRMLLNFTLEIMEP